MHRTLKEQTASPPAPTLADQQRLFDRFRADYNDCRPHEALGQVPPARVYGPSPRPMPARLLDIEYESDFEVRLVQAGGQFNWKGTPLRVTKALRGERIGFLQTGEDDWQLFYGPVLLCNLRRRAGVVRIEPIR